MAELFNPSDTKYDSQGAATLFPAGTYYLAAAGFVRKKGQKEPHTPYIDVKFVAVGGEYHGKSFWFSVMLSGQMLRKLAHWCRAVGVTEAFDIGSDAEIADRLLSREFKAQVTVDQPGPNAPRGARPLNYIRIFEPLSDADKAEVASIIGRLGDPLAEDAGGDARPSPDDGGSAVDSGDVPF